MVFGVIMGTGVGGGLVFDGRLWSGPQHIAGEWGHHSIDPNGPRCYCGQRGCVESFISGPAVQRALRERQRRGADDGRDRRARPRRRARGGRRVRRVPRPLRPRPRQRDLDPRSRRRRARRRPVEHRRALRARPRRGGALRHSTTSCARRSAATCTATPPASSAPPFSMGRDRLVGRRGRATARPYGVGASQST